MALLDVTLHLLELGSPHEYADLAPPRLYSPVPLQLELISAVTFENHASQWHLLISE